MDASTAESLTAVGTIVVAVFTVVIAVAAVVIGMIERNRSLDAAAFEKDRVLREWRREASFLIIDGPSRYIKDGKVTLRNASQLPFRHIRLQVGRYEGTGSPRPYGAAMRGYLGPGETVEYDLLDQSSVFPFDGGGEVDPINLTWHVTYYDHAHRRWWQNSTGLLAQIELVERDGSYVAVNEFEPLEEISFGPITEETLTAREQEKKKSFVAWLVGRARRDRGTMTAPKDEREDAAVEGGEG